MKIGKCARLLLAVTPVLAGCGNFWKAPSSTGTGTTSTSLSSGYFYVLNQATSQIVAYDIVSGALTQIAAYTLSAAPTAIAIAPTGSFLYVSTVAGIYLYDINSNGGLTIGNNSGVVSSDPATSIAIDPSGAWLVDAVQGTSGFQLDATPITSSGTFTGGTVATRQYAVTNATVHQVVLSDDGQHVFTAVGAGGTVVVPFASGQSAPLGSNGTVIQPVTSGGSALSVAVDPSSTPRLFYIGESLASGGTTGGLRIFNYSSLGGTLTQVSGSPFPSGGLAPNAILPVANGDYVYVGNGQGASTAGNITGFAITASSSAYTVASGSTVATGIQPFGLAEDSDSNFVLAASQSGNSDLEAYIFDATTTGKLDVALTSSTGTDPTQAIAVAAAP
ncbi:MAG TPA: beta-propeller fold lactonase family protein [Terracidiphilus sp.]|jgi:6-phosphogluconolactonase (cycloisomerase 2 family)